MMSSHPSVITGTLPVSRSGRKRPRPIEIPTGQTSAEVLDDHFTGARFRHGTKFLRWRPDKLPRQCTLKKVKFELKAGFGKLFHAKPVE